MSDPKHCDLCDTAFAPGQSTFGIRLNPARAEWVIQRRAVRPSPKVEDDVGGDLHYVLCSASCALVFLLREWRSDPGSEPAAGLIDTLTRRK